MILATFEGTTDGARGRRVAVVASRFNERVTRKLVEGALAGICGERAGWPPR